MTAAIGTTSPHGSMNTGAKAQEYRERQALEMVAAVMNSQARSET